MPKPVTRLDMATIIFGWEARRDRNGHLRVYPLPSNDGGGAEEVAGLNSRYNSYDLLHIKALLADSQWKAAEDFAIEAIARDTDQVVGWAKHQALEFFLRDSCFNRGKGSAAKILQMALHVKADGGFGPITRAALAPFESHPLDLLKLLRVSRENYEWIVAGHRKNMEQGMINRWDNCLKAAIEMV